MNFKPKKTLLVEGKIPANTECPYNGECKIRRAGECNHRGVKHDSPYSCAVARLYELIPSR